MTASPLYDTTALSNTSVPIRRQFRNVRRTRNGVPDVCPSSVTSIVNVSVRFGTGSPRIEDLGHDFVAHVEVRTGNHGLLGRDEQPHERRCPRRLARWFSQLRNRIELADGGLLVHAPEHGRDLDQQRPGGAAAEDGHVWRVPQFGGVDRLGSRPADVLLRDEVRGPQRHGVVRVHRRKELADQRQRSDLAAPVASRPARVPGDHERRTAATRSSRNTACLR